MPTDDATKGVFNHSLIRPLVVGGMSGAVATFITFPTFALKTRAQFGGRLTWRPRVLFRGSFGMASTSGGIIALNVLANDFFLRFYYRTRHPNFQQSLVCAATAGAAVAPIISLLEYSITLQQKVSVTSKASNVVVILANFLKKHGPLRAFVGMPAAIIRNAFISSCFLAFTPYSKRKLKPFIKNDFSASIAAGITTGLITCAFAYPLDTIKTNQQANADAPSLKGSSIWHMAKRVVQTRGVRGLYAGSLWYFVGLSSYITVIAYLNEKLTKAYDNHFQPEEPPHKSDRTGTSPASGGVSRSAFFDQSKQNDNSADAEHQDVHIKPGK